MRPRKKIAIVDNSTWSIYNFRLTLIRKLTMRGYEVLVIAPVDEYIHYLNDSYFTKHIPLHSLKPHSRNPFQDVLLTMELWNIYRREKPDLVIHFTIKPNIFGNFASYFSKVNSISTVTGLGYTFLHKNARNSVVPYLYRLAFKNVRRVVFYNKEDRELFENRKMLPEGKGSIISGSGINTNHFRPLPIPDKGSFVFLFIGRLLYDKGLLEYVNAARLLASKHENIECWVIGGINPQNPDSVSKDQLVEWIEAKHIRYFGLAKDVRHYIKRANAIVLPSFREGIPRSLLEGMAMGKPIITTDTAGCRETVEEGRNGYLVPARDAESLAKAMYRMFGLSDYQRELMGERSRDMALQFFDEKIIADDFLDLIRDVLDSDVLLKEAVGGRRSAVGDRQ